MFNNYDDCLDDAQELANKNGLDRGLEHNSIFKTWRHFGLPRPESRSGFELRCQVVMCNDWEKRTKAYKIKK